MIQKSINTIKDKLSPVPPTEREVVQEVKILRQITMLGGKEDKGMANSVAYLNRYPEYKKNLSELVSFHQYLKGSDYPEESTFVFIRTIDENENHATAHLDSLLLGLFNHYLQVEAKETYSLNLENITSKKKNSIADELAAEFKGTFITIDELPYILEGSPENRKKIVAVLKHLSIDVPLVFKGSEKDLQQIATLIGITSPFNFDCSAEYGYEELANVLESHFNSNNFVFEKEWRKYLRSFLSKPTEANRRKNYEYYENLIETLKKKALTDLKQAKTQSKKIVIKNEYYGVSLKGGNFSELESLKELDRLIGMEEAKENVRELIAYLEFNQKLQLRTGKSFPLNLHMMFTGSPGTGKTTIARVIASVLFELGYIKSNNLVEVDKKDLVSQYVGHTAIKTNEVIQRARGGVLFIDEAYSVPDDQFGKDAIATLIKAMSDLPGELVVIVAGYKDEMEEFVQSNPGIHSRIGKKIHFEDYNEEELLDIYSMKLGEYQIQTTDEAKSNLKTILAYYKTTENFGNGRFVDNLIQDLLFTYAVNTSGVEDEDMTFTITPEDLPKKYASLLQEQKTSTELFPESLEFLTKA